MTGGTFTPCGVTDDGEEAFCTTHLAEQTGRDIAKLRKLACGHYAAGRVSCGQRIKEGKVVPLGVAISLGLDER